MQTVPGPGPVGADHGTISWTLKPSNQASPGCFIPRDIHDHHQPCPIALLRDFLLTSYLTLTKYLRAARQRDLQLVPLLKASNATAKAESFPISQGAVRYAFFLALHGLHSGQLEVQLSGPSPEPCVRHADRAHAEPEPFRAPSGKLGL